MEIEYINKNIKDYKTDNITATIIEYEISEEDMLSLSNSQEEEYNERRILLYKDNIYNLIIDAIDRGYIIQGGLTSDNKYILSQYIVRKGLNDFMKMLSTI